MRAPEFGCGRASHRALNLTPSGVKYNQMVVHVELSETEMDRLFHALSASTRRDILRRTMTKEITVSELAREYDMSFSAVQKHISVLEEAQLIVKRAAGRERLVRADPQRIAQARVLLAQYEDLWRARVDRLDALLAESVEPTTP